MGKSSEHKVNQQQQVKRSLRAGVVGLGQCGGALALSFALLGYEAIAFNTSETDLRGLDLPDSRKFYMARKGFDGVGRDRGMGGAVFRANASKVLETVQRLLGRCEHFILCGGLAGGTGGNIGKLAMALGELKRPITIVGALPREGDGSLDKFNAVMALSEIVKSPFNSLILVDNTRISKYFPQATLDAAFKGANNFVSGQLDYVNRVIRDETIVPLQTFDGTDFKKIFTCRGLMVYGSTGNFSLGENLTPAEVIKRIIVDESLWPKGYDLSSAQRAALIVCAPDSFLNEKRGGYWRDWMEAMTNITKGCGCYFGLFRLPEGVRPRLMTLFAGLSFPEGVKELMDEARMEAQMMRLKMDKDIVTEEMATLEEYSFFKEDETLVEVEEDDGTGKENDEDANAAEDISQETELVAMGTDDDEARTSAAAAEIDTAISIDEHIEEQGQKRKAWYYIAAGLGIIALVTVVIAFQAGVFSSRSSVTEEEAQVANEPTIEELWANSVPKGCALIDSSAALFILAIDKSEGKLGVYANSGGLSLSSIFDCVVKGKIEFEQEEIDTPSGIYFITEASSDSTVRGYRLNYPSPVDSVDITQGEGLWIRGCSQRMFDIIDPQRDIYLKTEDWDSLSNYIVFNQTPILICGKMELKNAESGGVMGAEVRRFINRWRNAWTGRDFEVYARFYDDNFIPQTGTREGWLLARKRMFPNVRFIRVDISCFNVFDSGKEVVAIFNQEYNSDSYQDFGMKRIYIISRGGRWKIIAEDWFEPLIHGYGAEM